MGEIENVTFEKFYDTIEKNTEVNKMIENGKIYKYTNLMNGKVYIGQTKKTLEQRDKKHL